MQAETASEPLPDISASSPADQARIVELRNEKSSQLTELKRNREWLQVAFDHDAPMISSTVSLHCHKYADNYNAAERALADLEHRWLKPLPSDVCAALDAERQDLLASVGFDGQINVGRTKTNQRRISPEKRPFT